MGINDMNFKTLEWVFKHYPIQSVLELGAQTFYHTYKTAKYGEYADRYYKLKGVEEYNCIDLNGENGSLKLDLSVPHSVPMADLITDFGTSEHIAGYDFEDEFKTGFDGNNTWKGQEVHCAGLEAFYNCWTTKYLASKMLIISSNPATGHWPGHGHFYYTKQFYEELCLQTGMRAVVLEEHFAMGNVVDGKEVCCVLDVRGSKWISLEEFTKAFAFVYPK
jgi:hypothetical protein